jgi:hypothetical protein
MADPQATGAARVVRLPSGGLQTVGISARNLPPGIVFDVTFTRGGASQNVTFPATTGSFTSASAEADFDFGTEASTTVLSAIASTPINMASAPLWQGEPLSEMRVAFKAGELPRLEFLTRDGAALSHEAAMALAQQQGKYAFILNPVL